MIIKKVLGGVIAHTTRAQAHPRYVRTPDTHGYARHLGVLKSLQRPGDPGICGADTEPGSEVPPRSRPKPEIVDLWGLDGTLLPQNRLEPVGFPVGVGR